MKIGLLAIMLCTAATAADIAVVVNPKAAVDSLSQEQIANIFLGKATTFPNGAVAVPIDQNDGAIRDKFSSKVLKKDTAGVHAYWAKMQFTSKGQPPTEVSSNADVKKNIESNSSMIGYIEKSAVDNSVKVVGSF